MSLEQSSPWLVESLGFRCPSHIVARIYTKNHKEDDPPGQQNSKHLAQQYASNHQAIKQGVSWLLLGTLVGRNRSIKSSRSRVDHGPKPGIWILRGTLVAGTILESPRLVSSLEGLVVGPLRAGVLRCHDAVNGAGSRRREVGTSGLKRRRTRQRELAGAGKRAGLGSVDLNRRQGRHLGRRHAVRVVLRESRNQGREGDVARG